MSTPEAPDLFQYLDYQEFLRAYYAFEKSKDNLFSYRVFAACVQIDASLLVKILQGKRHLSREGTEKMVKFLRLSAPQSEYFHELIAYGKAQSDRDLHKHFEAMLRLRPAQSNRINADLYRYFQHWYYPAIRSALDVFEYHQESDTPALCRCFTPPLEPQQVQEAIDVLERLGLAKRNPMGRLIPASSHLSTGERWQSAAVREYQQQLIFLAAQSVQGIEKEKRDISSLTLALNSHQLERIRAILAEARQSIVTQVGAMPPQECNAVYQLNMQLFPVMRLKETP